MPTYLLGLDVGTTGCKALLVAEDGSVRASATSEYPMSTPQPLWAEQNPEDWWQAARQSIGQVLQQAQTTGADVTAVGLTGQMHGLVLLDAHGGVLRPCILWNDQRTAPQCEEITRKIGVAKLLELTGNLALPGFTAPKILWVRENDPEVFRRIASVLLPKDYLRYRLTGALASDVSDASGTLLLDVARRDWSSEMVAALGLDRRWLPSLTESPVVSAHVSKEAAAETGLVAGTPVVGGAGDQAAQAVGTGTVAEGVVSVTIGTSGAVFVSSDKYRPEPAGRLHAFCHAVPGKWHLMGVMLAAGGSFRWYRDTFGPPAAGEREQAKRAGRDAYDLLTEEAATVPAGSEGLLFLPYLSGERTPYSDPNARGVFFGLSLRHTRAHLTRAVLEGVTFGLRDSLELVRALGITSREVRASGGGAASGLWRQILADIFDSPIATVNVTEGAAYGAALLAGVGAGVYASVPEACDKVIRIREQVTPSPDARVYAALYERYRALYPALKNEFAALAALK